MWWGRARVTGLELLAGSGPLLIVPNHDSQWDPLLVALAARKRRQLRFLARANLWKIFALAPVLNGLHQIPIERGSQDSVALDRAIDALREGEAICVFCEGRLSLGRRRRARSGVGRLAAAVPDARVILCAVEGSTDFVRFPKRPRIAVDFFEPRDGQLGAGESADQYAMRLLDELRERVPPAAAGRKPERVTARLERKLAGLDG